MRTDVMVNSAGKACLVHDRPFLSAPVRAEISERDGLIRLYCVDGSVVVLPRPLDPLILDRLDQAPRLMIVEMRGGEPHHGREVDLTIAKAREPLQ